MNRFLYSVCLLLIITTTACQSEEKKKSVDVTASDTLTSVQYVSLKRSKSIFLKEKLSWKHYLAIFITILGIILLAVAEMLAE